MAERTEAEIKQDLAKLKAQNAELEASNKALQASAVEANAKLPIQGSYEATITDLKTNKKTKRKVAFVDGHKRIRIGGDIYPSEVVLKLANGADLDEAEKAVMLGMTQEAAGKHLTHLAAIGYSFLK